MVLTLTSTLPGCGPRGAVAVISVSESTVKLAAGVEPNSTAEAPPRFLPVIVTTVPPAIEPDGGETRVISGAGWTSALSSISSPGKVALGATIEPSKGVGKIDA